MNVLIWTIISSIIGIISTVVAYNYNPRQRLYKEIDQIDLQLKRLSNEKDFALKVNDSDLLTTITMQLLDLEKRKSLLLQRFK